ncbi:MAG: TonB-dependent receptor [Betaproteobacteria bacterium]|nr:TonB-dependent receptor [Betaproteobacteria bacterium]
MRTMRAFKTSAIALATLTSVAAFAQNSQETARVEVTGSSIKRVQSEGALPLQVITRDEIERAGITSAEQLVATLSVNGNGQDNMVSNQGGDFLNSLFFGGRAANNGSAGISMRGLGPQNTLVLLNGRRVASHGLNGKSVDLNTVPLSAIERVEILRDGASAIYGTDAIGGVINFILRKDFSGIEGSAFIDKTQHGGGDIRSARVLWGTGSLDRDRFNLMASFSADSQDRLLGSQRDFHNGYQPSRGLAMDTTGTPFATITAAAGTALGASFKLPGDATSYNRANLLAFQDITGFTNNNKACAYDYGKDWSLQQPVDRLNLVARGMFKLSENQVASFELTASNVKSEAQYTQNQITTVARGANYPVGGPYYLNLASLLPQYFKSTNDAADPRVFYDPTKPIRIRWRCLDCGLRTQETETKSFRALASLEGEVAGWDYRAGLSSAASQSTTNYLDGYLDEAKFKAAMDTGKINPFLLPGQVQTKEAIDLINGAKYTGQLYGGEARISQFDAVISRELFHAPGGAASTALGIDVRKESYVFNNGTLNAPAIIGAGSPATLNEVSRNIRAFFAEMQIPLVKNVLETQLALRQDRYDGFGTTTNPKIAARFTPTKFLLFRGSFNKGFHAPDFGPLYEGQNTGQFNSDINDPLLCAKNPGDVRYCKIRPAVITGGNPNLKPERSNQSSIGVVWEPTSWLSTSIDHFSIDLKDRIAARTAQEVIANYQVLSDYIVRKPSGEIDFVRAGYINVAGDRVSGYDLSVLAKTSGEFGRLNARLDGTYLSRYEVRKDDGSPWVDRVGQFGDFTYLWDLKLRWKHSASVNWSRGNWTTTLTQFYSSGYNAEVDGYGSGVDLAKLGYGNRVDSYTTYNLNVAYTGIKNLVLSAGIKNIFDKAPPFSYHNVDNVAGAGWDARVADPRLRAFLLRATYRFH